MQKTLRLNASVKSLARGTLRKPPRPFSACLGLLALLGCQALESCAPGPGVQGPRAKLALPTHHAAPDFNTEREAQALLGTMGRAEAAGDVDAARVMGERLASKYANTAAAATHFERQAHEALVKSDWPAALQALEQILVHRPQHPSIAQVRREYAILLVRCGHPDDALALWRSLSRSEAQDGRAPIGEALLSPLIEAGEGRRALELMVQLTEEDTTPARRARLLSWGQTVAGALLPLGDLDALWQAHRGQAPWTKLLPTIGLKLAKVHYHRGEHAAAEATLAQLEKMPLEGEIREQTQTFAAVLHSRFEVAADTIGVLLPLTGRFAQFGERSLAAVKLALERTPQLKLVVKDTGGEANAASQAIESLVFEHHAIAAIGPLFSGEAAAAAVKAEELGLPLLSLSHREGLASLGNEIFRTALTVQAQAEELARVATEQLGMRRFAILYPRSRYGVDFTQAFWDAVELRHGEIRGVESYDPQATTFREPVRRLVGRWYLGARPEFHAAMTALKERELSSMRMRSEIERLDKRTPPIVDFDALIVPDSGRQLGLIAPAVAFEDVLLSHDLKVLDKMRRALGQPDMQPITLLGGSTWNNAGTLDGCEQYCEDAVFVDAFFAGSSDIRVRDFVSAFNQLQGSEPLLSEAQAFDTTSYLAQTLGRAQAPISGRKDLREALLNRRDFSGVCGPMRFDEHGEAQKSLQVLTIRNHAIVPWTRERRRRS